MPNTAQGYKKISVSQRRKDR